MPPRKKKQEYVFATVNTLVVGTFGRSRLRVGDCWYADHPVVRKHPDMFSEEPPEVHPRGWSPPVEQATAAPGETRQTSRTAHHDDD